MKDFSSSNLENLTLNWGSVLLAVLICGSIAPEVRIPIKTAVHDIYQKAKTIGKITGKFLYKDRLYY